MALHGFGRASRFTETSCLQRAHSVALCLQDVNSDRGEYIGIATAPASLKH